MEINHLGPLIVTPPNVSSVTFVKFLNFSKPQIPHL